MGADFLLYCCASPDNYGYTREDAEKALHKWVQRRNLDQLDVFYQDMHGDSLADVLGWGEETPVEALARVGIHLRTREAQRLREARDFIVQELVSDLDVFFEWRRDTVVLTFGHKKYVFSGGMSWGDEPTEAGPALNRIAMTGIFGRRKR
jgi:hypothetical protein